MPTPTNFEGINPRGTQTLIPCKDAKAQNGVIANTKLIKDTVGWSGKNRYNNANTNGKPGSVLTKTDTGFRCVVSTDSTWNGATNELRCSANVGFILSLDTAITSGITYITVAGSTDGSTYTTITNSSILTTSRSVNLEFNTGNYTYLRISFFTTNNDIKTCDVTISNIMLRDADILDPTYEPYFGSTAFPRSEQAVLGAKNIFNKSKTPSGYDANATYAELSTGVEIANATAGIYASARWDDIPVKPNTTYILTTDIEITSGKSGILVRGTNDGTSFTELLNKTSDSPTGEVSYTFNTGNYTKLRLNLYSAVTTSESGDVKYKDFMIRLASDTDPTYAPFAMTNRELTDAVAYKTITASKVTGLSAYDVTTSISVIQIGKVVFVRFNLKSLTADVVPIGQSWIDVLEGLPRPVYDVNLNLSSGSGGNDVQLLIPSSGNNYNLQARGGKINDTYFVCLSYVAS